MTKGVKYIIQVKYSEQYGFLDYLTYSDQIEANKVYKKIMERNRDDSTKYQLIIEVTSRKIIE